MPHLSMSMETLPTPHEAARDSLRDALRSARRWQELLSPAERRRLLSDIARTALAIGRDLFPERGIGDLDLRDDRNGDGCPRERLAFLASAWPRLETALHGIEAAPYQTLTRETRLALPERARRVPPMAVLAALRTGDWVAAPPGGPLADLPLAARWNNRLPRRIAESVAIPSDDTSENRTIKTCLAHFARDLSAISRLAQAFPDPEVAGQSERLRARVRRHLVRVPWRSLPRSDRTPTLTPTLRAHGQYRLIYDTYRRYRQGFRLDWDNPLFALPARETWRLYEYWGFFETLATLRRMVFRVTRADGFSLLRHGLTFSLAQGAASRVNLTDAKGRTVSVVYNREFPRGDVNTAGWHSRSHALRPDITIEAGGRLLVLDTKFKTYAEPGWEIEDIRQMHAYRDAITHDGERGVVSAAWLLYAGRRDGANRPVIAYPASAADHPFGTGDVGALLLRSGGVGSRVLQALLARFVEAAF